MKKSDEINQIAGALSLAQGEIKNPEKVMPTENTEGKNYKSAPIAAFFDAVKMPFAKNNLCFIQDVTVDEERKRASCATMIMHSSGQWLEFEALTFHYEKATPEDRGMAIYLVKKHSFQSAVGMAAQDEIEEAGSKPRRDVFNHFASTEDRKAAKQAALDDLELVKSAGTQADLDEVWAKHKDNIDKLSLEDPQYVLDVIRLKRQIEDGLKKEADQIEGKV